ncbi:hypothetical protein AVT46_gp11 [Mycobacterium phage MOOREtheMARYer]|uniref:Uncharacterized protein n=1 Tax=Mycobacterium phage MOOREtheMARYer TaxID=1647309 RepID=A0A0F6SJV4_9CAUD|nr:hypothetical protein AVT46_gp11 [Mycobacterium phage MOOREtheMARYer]AKF14872.1 hypothetical protein SEA_MOORETHEMARYER_11 [Mycobacterium phage MOOREtheMARYer]
MGRLSIPISDHREIRRDRKGTFGVRQEVRRIAVTIKVVATQIAGDVGRPSGHDEEGYGIEEQIGTDRVREKVWAATSATEKAEAQRAPLQQAAARVR